MPFKSQAAGADYARLSDGFGATPEVASVRVERCENFPSNENVELRRAIYVDTIA
jgi:hypothetical protein